MLPKRRFWKTDRTPGNVFSQYFSNGVSTPFGRRSFEKYIENTFPDVRSIFQNLRLGSIKWRLSQNRGRVAYVWLRVYLRSSFQRLVAQRLASGRPCDRGPAFGVGALRRLARHRDQRARHARVLAVVGRRKAAAAAQTHASLHSIFSHVSFRRETHVTDCCTRCHV